MAKTSMIEREKKRAKTRAKYAKKRAELKAIVANPEVGFDEKQQAMFALQKLPRDSSPVRQRNRCQRCGRPRGFLRKFGICRICFRDMALRGEIPGLRKASW